MRATKVLLLVAGTILTALFSSTALPGCHGISFSLISLQNNPIRKPVTPRTPWFPIFHPKREVSEPDTFPQPLPQLQVSTQEPEPDPEPKKEQAEPIIDDEAAKTIVDQLQIQKQEEPPTPQVPPVVQIKYAVILTMDNCPACDTLDRQVERLKKTGWKVGTDPDCHIRKINVATPEGTELADKNKLSLMPALLLYNPEGTRLAVYTGSMTAEEFNAWYLADGGFQPKAPSSPRKDESEIPTRNRYYKRTWR